MAHLALQPGRPAKCRFVLIAKLLSLPEGTPEEALVRGRGTAACDQGAWDDKCDIPAIFGIFPAIRARLRLMAGTVLLF
jgi:hypothetical protein